MDIVRQELIDAGIIDKAVAPMMVADAVVNAVRTAVATVHDKVSLEQD